MSKMSILSSEFCGKKKFRALNNRERIREKYKLTFDIHHAKRDELQCNIYSLHFHFGIGIFAVSKFNLWNLKQEGTVPRT